MSRGNAEDAEATRAKFQSSDTEKPEPNWLRHTQDAAYIDYALIEGATIDDLVRHCKNRDRNGVLDHIRHLTTSLERGHGLRVIKDGEVCKFNMVMPDIAMSVQRQPKNKVEAPIAMQGRPIAETPEHTGNTAHKDTVRSQDVRGLIERYGFRKYADIYAATHSLAGFGKPEGHWSGQGYVYLWVELYGDEVRVVYVGKAGTTMRARCGQHENGFRSSTTGKKHNTRIMDGLNQGRTYSVYARQSPSQTILDEPGISMCTIEEVALIWKFDPPWNKLK